MASGRTAPAVRRSDRHLRPGRLRRRAARTTGASTRPPGTRSRGRSGQRRRCPVRRRHDARWRRCASVLREPRATLRRQRRQRRLRAGHLGRQQLLSTEAWFNSTTTTGAARSSASATAQTGGSSNYDKHIYMTTTAALVFGVWNGSFDTVVVRPRLQRRPVAPRRATQGPTACASTSTTSWSDQTPLPPTRTTPATGESAATTSAWPYQGSSKYFAGDIDDVAIYAAPSRLTRSTTTTGRRVAPDPTRWHRRRR